MPLSSENSPLLSVENLRTTFPVLSPLLRRQVGEVEAVAGVSFALDAGKTLGLVGESGSGKSTVARTILGLESASSGFVFFDGDELTSVSLQRLRKIRRKIQMVFQDPYASLNPRRSVEEIISEPWEVHSDVVPKRRRRTEVKELLERVGLDPDHAGRYPHQFSGGQRQRIGIARALALRPKLIICDEAVSALDVSIQAQILNLLRDLQDDLGVALLFIAHDLSVVRYISDDVAVMYLGKIVEYGEAPELFESPTHPYTQALLSAIPPLRPWADSKHHPILLAGDIPSPANPPTGCRFRTRCWKAEEVCAEVEPPLETRLGLHESACHFATVESRLVDKGSSIIHQSEGVANGPE